MRDRSSLGFQVPPWLFILRLGYRFDQGASSHAISGGLGYLTREFMIDASVRRTIAGPEATTIFLGAGYFLESSGLTGRGEEL